MNIEEIEQDLIKTCEAAQLKGWSIGSSRTYDPSTTLCCALGAHYVLNPPYHLDNVSYVNVAETKYGMTYQQIYAFVDGFDNTNYNSDSEYPTEFMKLGQRLRERFVQEYLP